MIESVNITAFLVFTVVLYSVLIFLSLYYCNLEFRKRTGSVFLSIQNVKLIGMFISFAELKVLLLIVKVAAYSVSLLYSISLTASSIESFLIQADRIAFAEPFNLTAVVFRKFYGENERLMLAAAAGLIVVFYFILTVF